MKIFNICFAWVFVIISSIINLFSFSLITIYFNIVNCRFLEHYDKLIYLQDTILDNFNICLINIFICFFTLFLIFKFLNTNYNLSTFRFIFSMPPKRIIKKFLEVFCLILVAQYVINFVIVY